MSGRSRDLSPIGLKCMNFGDNSAGCRCYCALSATRSELRKDCFSLGGPSPSFQAVRRFLVSPPHRSGAGPSEGTGGQRPSVPKGKSVRGYVCRTTSTGSSATRHDLALGCFQSTLADTSQSAQICRFSVDGSDFSSHPIATLKGEAGKLALSAAYQDDGGGKTSLEQSPNITDFLMTPSDT